MMNMVLILTNMMLDGHLIARRCSLLSPKASNDNDLTTPSRATKEHRTSVTSLVTHRKEAVWVIIEDRLP
jgi:hypothetical protein